MAIDWGQVFNVVFSGLIIVFIVLYMLIIAVNIMGRFSGNNKPAPASAPETPAKTEAAVSASGNNEVVAVISAAVAAYMDEEAPGVPYAVTGIAQRAVRPKELRPAWGFAGMRQNTEPF